MIRIYRDPDPAGAPPAGAPPAGAPPAGAPPAVTITPESLNALQGDAFKALLPEEIRSAGWLKDVNTFGDFVKKSAGAQSLIGQRAVPGDNATAEEWNNYFKMAGRPEKPEAYLVPKIEGIPQEYADKQSEMGVLRSILHKSGMNQYQANTFLSEFIKTAFTGEQAEKAAAEKSFSDVMDATFGKDRQAIVENGKKYLASVLPANVAPLLNGLSDNAWGVLLAATDSIVRKFGQEDSFRGGQGGAGGQGGENMESLTAQMRNIMGQKEYQDPFINKNKHAELNAQMEIIRNKMRALEKK